MSSPDESRSSGVSLRRRFFSLPTLLSFAVAIAFIYFLATRFDIDWAKTFQNVRGTDRWSYLLALVLYYLSFVFRGLRWRVLAGNAGMRGPANVRLPSALRFAQLILMGWFVNSVTWLRLGDAYRAYAFSEDSKGGFSWSLGTVFAERVVDMATVFALIVIGVALYSATRDSGGVEYILAAAFLMAGALALLLVFMKGYGARVARYLPKRVGPAYLRFQEAALGSLRQRRLAPVFGLGLAAWLLEVARLSFVVQALDMNIGVPLVLVVALSHAILSTVPTPGGVGAVEPGVTGLLVLGMAREDAVSIVLVDRSVTYLSVIIFGGLAFLLWHVSRARRRRSHRSKVVGEGRLADV